MHPSRRLGVGIVYPTWNAVPKASEHHAEKSVGVKQGRLTCNNPPLQTLPRTGPGAAIKKTLTTRWAPGYYLAKDYAQ